MNKIIQYLIGISAAFSGKYDESILILSELLSSFNTKKLSQYDNNLCKEIKSFISESYRMKAFNTYDKYEYSFDNNTIHDLNLSLHFNPNNIYTHELLSIYYFVKIGMLNKLYFTIQN